MVRNFTGDEGGPFEAGSQVLASSHRKLLSSKAMVVSVAGRQHQFDRISQGINERMDFGGQSAADRPMAGGPFRTFRAAGTPVP